MFYDFHIHFATERYQELGAREDAYARPTDRHDMLRDALGCLVKDANIGVGRRAGSGHLDLVGC